MIKNFEKETCPLSKYELDTLVPAVVRGLAGCIGRKRAITNRHFIRTKMDGMQINESRLRKCINHIRTKGLIHGLMATSKGYYIAESRQELEDYLLSLKGREDALKELRRSIRKQMEKLFPSNAALA